MESPPPMDAKPPRDAPPPSDPPGSHPGDTTGEPVPPPSGFFSRLVKVIVAPATLFRELRRHPKWGDALIAGIVLSALAAALIPVGLMEETVREQIVTAGGDAPTSPETMARVMWVIGIFGAIVVWPLLVLVTSALNAFLFLFLFGYEGSFRILFSIVAHAVLIMAVGALLLTPLKMVTGDPTLTLSVATFLPFLEDGFARNFLGLLDLFNIWVYVLVGIGAAIMDATRSLRHGIAVSVGASLLISLLIAGIVTAARGLAG